VLTQADVGSTIRFKVTATNGGGATAATSAQTATVVSNEQTVNLGVAPASLSWGCCYGPVVTGGSAYTWSSAGSGSNIWSFTFGNVPSGWGVKKIRVVSLAGNSGYATQSHSLQNGGTTVASLTVPAGAAQDCRFGCGWDNTVDYTADLGWVTFATPLTVTQAAAQLRYYQDATNWIAFARTPTAQAVIVPPPAPTNTTLPTISGTPNSGRTLTADPGTWNNAPTAFAYSWLRCDATGAACVATSTTTTTYALTAADVGKTMRVDVTGTNVTGSATARSAASGVIGDPLPDPPANTTAPSISGSAIQGVTLTGADGSWTGSPTGYSREWQRCNTSGASCQAISGATASTYVLTQADVASTIRFKVTATNGGGPTAATSTQTATVVSNEQTVNLGVAPVSLGWGCCYGPVVTGGSAYTWSSGGSGSNVWSFTFGNVPSGWVVKKIRVVSLAGNSGYATQWHGLQNGGTTVASLTVPAGAAQDCRFGCGWDNTVDYSADLGWVTFATPLTAAQAAAQLRYYQEATNWIAFARTPTAQAVIVPG
jgi:hypothetical protein